MKAKLLLANIREKWVVALMVTFFFCACEIINPEEEIPAYLFIESIELETNFSTQGSSSEKITEVWVSVDGGFLGVYDLPATVPVLKEGKHLVLLQAGIKDNGIGSTPDIYPFYENFEVELDLKPGETYKLHPVISYEEGIRFGFIENFEGTTNVFQDVRYGRPQDRFYRTEADAFEGNFSGVLAIDTDQPLVELATLDSYSGLLDKGFSVYLEMNYKSEVPVVFGLIGSNTGSVEAPVTIFHAGFRPKDSWNKIYFNFSQLILDGGFDQYKVTMEVFLPQEGGSYTITSGKVWLDNVKLVYF